MVWQGRAGDRSPYADCTQSGAGVMRFGRTEEITDNTKQTRQREAERTSLASLIRRGSMGTKDAGAVYASLTRLRSRWVDGSMPDLTSAAVKRISSDRSLESFEGLAKNTPSNRGGLCRHNTCRKPLYQRALGCYFRPNGWFNERRSLTLDRRNEK